MGQGHDSVIVIPNRPRVDGKTYQQRLYRGLRCAGCGRGGMLVYANNGGSDAALVDFYPRSLDSVAIPHGVPNDLRSEFRERLASRIGDASLDLRKDAESKWLRKG